MKKVTTASGSTYMVDEDAMTATRVESTHELRRDGDVCKLILLLVLEVGEQMEMLVDIREDGVVTARRTSIVESIEGCKCYTVCEVQYGQCVREGAA